ncbi:hypothetical protein BH10BAC4_BH10BAC4_08740 [soil metagenome]
MTDGNFKLISKYALLLSISYLLEYTVNRYVKTLDTDTITMANRILILNSPVAFTLLLNIITSMIVYGDKT